MKIEHETIAQTLPLLTAFKMRKGPKIIVKTAPNPCVMEFESSCPRVYFGSSVLSGLMTTILVQLVSLSSTSSFVY